jgi:glucose/arabinose dehydrogenase
MPYHTGDPSESNPVEIVSVRTGSIPAGNDGDVHRTTSVAAGSSRLFIAVGSSCNACTEVDSTRAAIQVANLDGSGLMKRATRIRNAMALALDANGALWAGGAGQDDLAQGHPYEFFDDVSLHAGVADYGWPVCEENHVDYGGGSDDCAATAAPLVEFPAYSTIIGAVFYPASPAGPYAFPAGYRGGAFVSMHGSWHNLRGRSVRRSARRVRAVRRRQPRHAGRLERPHQTVDGFHVWGFQDGSGNRIGRTTGLAVGVNGSLFVADDQTGNIYRIRPH